MKSGYLFLPVYFPGGYALAEALAESGHPTQATAFYDWLTYRRLRPTWPVAGRAVTALTRSMRIFPPGYAGRLEPLLRPYLKRMIARWIDELAAETHSHPWVVVTYPYVGPWIREVPSERLVYYNIDEYTLYRPERADIIRRQEDELVDRAALTLCVSEFQVRALATRHQSRSSAPPRVRHLPLGVIESYLNSRPDTPPSPGTVGYVGNLIERIDWRLVADVALACPELTFIFVGGLGGFAGLTDEAWKADRAAALKLPNVRHVQEVPQTEVAGYYWSFAVNWIPYAVDHPFNRASCPTKLMDGLASGRPVVSTSIPECRLYPRWISIADTAGEMARDIRRQMAIREEPVAAAAAVRQQVAFARQHTWQQRARQCDQLLSVTFNNDSR